REGGPSHAAAPVLALLGERHGQVPQRETPVARDRVPGKNAQHGAEADGGAVGQARKDRQGDEQRAHPELAPDALYQPDLLHAGDVGGSSGGGHPTRAARISWQRSRTAPRPAGTRRRSACPSRTSKAFIISPSLP